MIRIAAAACLAVSLLAVSAFAQATGPAGTSPQSLTQQDRQFLDHAARDNQGEIRIALLAVKQAENPAVKAFARLMIDDHAAIESQLANVLGQLQVPTSNGITSRDETGMRQLEGSYGHQFDLQFMHAQVQDHASDVRDFTREIQTTHNQLVWALAQNTLPVLQQHLMLAEAVDRFLSQGQQQAMGTQR